MLLNLRGASGPLYRPHLWRTQVRHPRGQIGSGCGACHRRGALAADLGVSRNTVMLAYEQLLAEGYVVSRDRSTTLVARRRAFPSAGRAGRTFRHGPCKGLGYAQRLTQNPAMPPSASYASRPGLRYDFRYGRPAMDEFPREIWRRLLTSRARRTRARRPGYASRPAMDHCVRHWPNT